MLYRVRENYFALLVPNKEHAKLVSKTHVASSVHQQCSDLQKNDRWIPGQHGSDKRKCHTATALEHQHRACRRISAAANVSAKKTTTVVPMETQVQSGISSTKEQ